MRPINSRRPLMAVLWDMDGTIVDTEPYWIEAEHSLVEAHGATWSDSQADELVGQSLDHTAKVLQTAGVALDDDEIIATLLAHVERRVRDHLPWRPGALELLEELHTAGIQCALVTMSYGSLVRAVLDRLPTPFFDVIVTGDSVTSGKPHPEAYTSAIALLRRHDPALTVDECVAIEDSGPGVSAAMAAGVTTIGIPYIAPLPDDPNLVLWDSLAGKTVDDLEQLIAPRTAV